MKKEKWSKRHSSGFRKWLITVLLAISVLMTGYSDETPAHLASLPLLSKPFIRQDLARALQRAHRDTP